jgi:hypothetical protein
MADQLQLRGGTTAETATFTGALREVTVDTDKDTLVVHDNTLAGGYPLLRQDLSNLPAGTIDNADINASAAIVDTKLDTIATAGKVSNSATTATDANTASAIVARDASGNFTAGTITAALTGAASSNVLKAGDTMTGALVVPLASAATPSITFTGDLNTGIYSPGADQVAISTGGSGRLFVDASGRILAGTASSSIGGSGSIVLQGSAGPGVVRAAFGGTSPGSTDILGAITFTDSSHTGAAYIYGSRDGGTWTSTTSQPSAITFGTTPNGSGTAFERLRITSAGLVGIGTSAPSSKLEIGGATNGSTLTFSCTSSNPATERLLASVDYKTGGVGSTTMFAAYSVAGLADNASTLRFYTDTGTGTQQERLRITGAGNVGIGTTAPGALLHAAGKIRFGSNASYYGEIDHDAGSTGSNIYDHSDSGGHIFRRNGTEHLRIDSSGRLLVGTSSLLLSSGIICSYFDGSAANGMQIHDTRTTSGTDTAINFTRNTTNNVGSISTTTTSTAFNTSSDYRLKENVSAITDGITRLQQLKPSRFNFIADPDHTIDGFVAHEAQAIVPECVTGEKDAVDGDGKPVYQGIDQSKLVPLLTAALQEAIGEIESLKARVVVLESA